MWRQNVTKVCMVWTSRFSHMRLFSCGVLCHSYKSGFSCWKDVAAFNNNALQHTYNVEQNIQRVENTMSQWDSIDSYIFLVLTHRHSIEQSRKILQRDSENRTGDLNVTSPSRCYRYRYAKRPPLMGFSWRKICRVFQQRCSAAYRWYQTGRSTCRGCHWCSFWMGQRCACCEPIDSLIWEDLVVEFHIIQKKRGFHGEAMSRLSQTTHFSIPFMSKNAFNVLKMPISRGILRHSCKNGSFHGEKICRVFQKWFTSACRCQTGRPGRTFDVSRLSSIFLQNMTKVGLLRTIILSHHGKSRWLDDVKQHVQQSGFGIWRTKVP